MTLTISPDDGEGKDVMTERENAPEARTTGRDTWQTPSLVVVGADDARNNDSGNSDGVYVS